MRFLLSPMFLALAGCILAACSGSDSAPRALAAEGPPVDGRLFTRMPSDYTGVRFVNRLTDTREMNVFTYRNFYNGGGVALGDLTGDGLPELFLTSNLEGNRLYLNEGNFRFREITEAAGVEGRGAWATGATFADVNGDGRLDLYVCFAGNADGERRANELYIHQGLNGDGLPTFAERAEEYGIADEAYSTHAAFFDYDRDGRLDFFLVNNSFRPVSSFGLRNIRHVRNALGGHKLYRNTGDGFVDVSEQAGIYGSEIGFGLGVAVGDVDRDGWPDIYVSNDFFERDYLYINRRDGTFDERLEEQMPSISMFSMGLDMADIDGDGWLDLYVTDMLPEDNYRLKMTSSFENWDTYQTKLKNDYHHQFMRNMLHLNNGNGTFSEVGQMAGVAMTDWSWSALIADFDQDGHQDIHVTNGIARDLTSQDYIAFLANDETMKSATRGKRVDFLKLVEAMGSTKLPDYGFRNTGDLSFTNMSGAWGIDEANFSNGAAYGDLDGDGALDLVVNNINDEAFIFRNNARTLTKHRWLQVDLEGEGANRFAIGATVTAHAAGRLHHQALMPSRGFQSSVDYRLTFGLGTADTVDSVTVDWPDGRRSVLRGVAADQRLTVRQAEAAPAPARPRARPATLFRDVTRQLALDVRHRENEFADFDRERLLPKMISTEGPQLAVGDVNGDGLDDLYLGGAKDQAGQLLLQRADGRFASTSEAVFAADRISEDVGALFFDADGDRDLDLYVVSGGNEFSDMAPALRDRLYLNDGRGSFRKARDHLPFEHVSGSRVAASDFDGDGDLDLFVGGRVIPGSYGIDPVSMLLRNDGRGRFTDVTAQAAPELRQVGLVTDAVWADVDGDRRDDLIVVGEWMPVTIFRARGGKLERLTVRGLEKSHGWWNRIVTGDFNGDRRVDFAIGNLGLNSRLRASPNEPASMHVGDFDDNGFVEQIVAFYSGGKSYPLALRDDLIKTLSSLKSRYLNYEDYAEQTVTDIFAPAQLAKALHKETHTFATSVAINKGDGSFALVPLPAEAQLAPVYGMLAEDIDRDGALDLVIGGNFDAVKPEIGRLSASYGLFLKGDGRGGFTPVRTVESGFLVPGETRDIRRVRTRDGALYVVARNDAGVMAFRAGEGMVAAAVAAKR